MPFSLILNMLRCFYCCVVVVVVQPVYDTKKVIAILTYNQMPETDELRFEVLCTELRHVYVDS